MLYSIDTQEYVKTIPHRHEYDIWKSHLSDEQYQSIFIELDHRVEGDEVHTSSWIPGSDWTRTVFQPIYITSCRQDEEAAAKFFGLILWDVMLHREEIWSFGRYQKNGIDIKGLTYFRLHSVP